MKIAVYPSQSLGLRTPAKRCVRRSRRRSAVTVGKLLHGGLVEEVPARGALPVWRRDDDAGPLALRITSDGLAIAAIGVEAGVAGREITAQPGESGEKAMRR